MFNKDTFKTHFEFLLRQLFQYQLCSGYNPAHFNEFMFSSFRVMWQNRLPNAHIVDATEEDNYNSFSQLLEIAVNQFLARQEILTQNCSNNLSFVIAVNVLIIDIVKETAEDVEQLLKM